MIAQISRGDSMPDLASYLFGPGRHNVLWDFQSRSVMLQVLTVSLLNIGSWVV
jgi:hypothetical protein